MVRTNGNQMKTIEWKPSITADAPWTQGPWTVGPKPHGHCRIYAASETHAIARTYGSEFNGIGVCELTGPKNYADAIAISELPVLLEIAARLQAFEAAAGESFPQCPGAYSLLVAVKLSDSVFDRIISATGAKSNA